MSTTMMSYYIDIPADQITADNIEEAKKLYSEALHIADDAKSTAETLGAEIALYEDAVGIIAEMVEDEGIDAVIDTVGIGTLKYAGMKDTDVPADFIKNLVA